MQAREAWRPAERGVRARPTPLKKHSALRNYRTRKYRVEPAVLCFRADDRDAGVGVRESNGTPAAYLKRREIALAEMAPYGQGSSIRFLGGS